MSADQLTTNSDETTPSSLTPLTDGDTTRPNWARGFDRVAVQAGLAEKQHKPDLTSDEPRPACGAPDYSGAQWRAVEHDPQKEHCAHQCCHGSPADETPQHEPTPARARKAASDRRQRDLGGYSDGGR